MADTENAAIVTIPWPEFLADTPPGRVHHVSRVWSDVVPDVQITGIGSGYATTEPTQLKLASPEIDLYCDSDQCSAVMAHDGELVHGDGPLHRDKFASFMLSYVCRHCLVHTKLIAVMARTARLEGWKSSHGCAAKLGEWPPFGPHIPTKAIELFSPYRDLFFQGRRAESQGMGVGAFAYYRRVVESSKDLIFEQIIKVLKRTGSQKDSTFAADLETAKKQPQFTTAVDSIKAALPESLMVKGKNPLLLLHKALSHDLHAGTDEEALEKAQAIRLVLVELAERMAHVMKDDRELTDAVKLLDAKPTVRESPAEDHPDESATV